MKRNNFLISSFVILLMVVCTPDNTAITQLAAVAQSTTTLPAGSSARLVAKSDKIINEAAIPVVVLSYISTNYPKTDYLKLL